jgi:hypothetical protein
LRQILHSFIFQVYDCIMGALLIKEVMASRKDVDKDGERKSSSA